jgi:hypothetical protein
MNVSVAFSDPDPEIALRDKQMSDSIRLQRGWGYHNIVTSGEGSLSCGRKKYVLCAADAE